MKAIQSQSYVILNKGHAAHNGHTYVLVNWKVNMMLHRYAFG